MKQVSRYGVDPYCQALINILVSTATASPNSKAFELAIGTGWPFAAALQSAGVTVRGCDISSLLAEKCNATLGSGVAEVFNFENGVTKKEHIGDYDVVYCVRSTWYFEDLIPAIDFMVSLSRSGGRIFFDIMNADSGWVAWELRRKRIAAPITAAKNMVKFVVSFFDKSYISDSIFGIREKLHSEGMVDRYLTARGFKFRKVKLGDLISCTAIMSDQKIFYEIVL